VSAHPDSDLGVYVLGVLPASDSTRLRMHLETCAACRARVDELEGISELLSAARLVPDAPAGLVEAALASLPPRRPSGSAADGGAAGDFVVGPTPRPTAPSGGVRRRVLVAAAATLVVVTCAALAWLLTSADSARSVTLVPAGATARGVVRVDSDGTGAGISLHATGLAAGEYESDLDGHPAGSFYVTDGVADVELHTSAVSGRFVVRHVPDGSVVFEADLG